MTLLKAFNKALEELPTISKKLEDLILTKEWPEEKSQQAIKIIKQLQKDNLIHSDSKNQVKFSYLTLQLSPKECGVIYSSKFNEENIPQAVQYITDLIDDINILSPEIRFSFYARTYSDYRCLFYIYWEL